METHPRRAGRRRSISFQALADSQRKGAVVLMFPTLLDDQYLVNEFQVFIEEIEKSHDLNLAGSQHYPGVYALLFFGSGRARAIGLRLAGYMGKLRGATDLEPLQPLLRKYIGFLEMDVLPAILDTSRPRVQLEQTNVWLGIKSLLSFLEASALEDGIVEKYPKFPSIVLNHVGDDTVESSYAITCLRMSFEMLGCKLWWRTTLSPSVMRNTLLGMLAVHTPLMIPRCLDKFFPSFLLKFAIYYAEDTYACLIFISSLLKHYKMVSMKNSGGIFFISSPSSNSK